MERDGRAMTTPRLLSERYELGETLGYGGMSEVHRGRDVRLGRDVAIKVLRADLARDPQFQHRFRKEAPLHDLLQISSHAWLQPFAPMSSSLLLSGSDLSVGEISRLGLKKTRLADTNVNAFQRCWFTLEAAAQGYSGIVSWDAYHALYD